MTAFAHVFALTGGIGSGKSTVAAHWRDCGLPVVDADQLARDVVQKGTPGLAALTAVFGGDILDSQGNLDRNALGSRVFTNDADRQLLEGIVHPLVSRAAQEAFEAHTQSGARLVCYEVPLLFETDQAERYRPVVVVSVPPPAQLARTMSRDMASETAVQARIDAQLPLHEKAERADYVIDNSGTVAETRQQADLVLTRIRERIAAHIQKP